MARRLLGRDTAALWVVAFGVFIAADDLMVVATMLRPIIDDLGLRLPDDLDSTAWIVNVYLIAYIATIPLAGRLSDIFGRRSVFVSGLGIFLVGSLIVPTAGSFRWLLVGRALSAIGGGALVPVALAVAGDVFTGARRTKALGTLGAVETMGWVWGPLYGAVLVRLLSWEWQFYLNVPLSLIGMALAWRTLDGSRRSARRIDWSGAALLTAGLIALNLALLGQARIQSVTGLDELTGGGTTPAWRGPWMYMVAGAAFGALALVERRRSRPVVARADDAPDPIVNLDLGLGWGPIAALVVNALIGVGLVIALVNVPLFVNVVESGKDRSIGSTALLAGWLLSALTVTMAVASYAGGVFAGRSGNRRPVLLGLVIATAGFASMGRSWDPGVATVTMASELAVVGLGVGLALAPISDAVVGSSGDDDRGTGAGLVLMFRLIGFSVGLAALTAWGLHRYSQLRESLVLPPVGTPGYQTAYGDAVLSITAKALSETFAGAGIGLAVAVLVAWLIDDGATTDGRSPGAGSPG